MHEKIVRIKRTASFVVLACMLLSLVLSQMPVFASDDAGISWQMIYKQEAYQAITYGNSLYVLVGDNGLIKVSKDGISWENVQPPDLYSFKSVVYGKGMFVAVGDGIAMSEDGYTWHSATTSYDGMLTSVACNDDTFVAAGENGKVWTSTDGITWEKNAISDEEPYTSKLVSFTSVGSNGTSFVAASQYRLYYSSEGSQWRIIEAIDPGYADFQRFIVSGGKFYTYPQYHMETGQNNMIFVSEDGLTWNTYDAPHLMLNSFIDAGGNLQSMSVGDGFTLIRNKLGDDMAWQSEQIHSDISAANTGEKFFYAGERYFMLCDPYIVYYSDNGLDWTKVDLHSDFPYDKQTMTWFYGTQQPEPVGEKRYQSGNTATNGEIYVRVGGTYKNGSGEGYFGPPNTRTLSVSTDNENWETTTENNRLPYTKAVYGNGVFAVIGATKSALMQPPTEGSFIKSTDGVNWEAVDGDVPYDIIWDGEQFLAAFDYCIKRSPDLVNWETDYIPGTVSKLYWNDEEYVGVGNGIIFRGSRSPAFWDVQGHWGESAIMDLEQRSIVSGVGDNTFEPDRSITRAEFAAILTKALLLKPAQSNAEFSDVDKSQWYYEYITTAYENGLISGYGDGTMCPENTISREEAITMTKQAVKHAKGNADISENEIEETLQFYSDAGQISGWARDSFAVCIKNGIISGYDDGQLKPYNEITRAEAAQVIYTLIH